jgi:hypothetical protein
MKTNKIFRSLLKLNNQTFINSSVKPQMGYNI